jgi:Rap1a immunity proteins
MCDTGEIQMRTLAFAIVALSLSVTCQAQSKPQDGNQMLDFCKKEVAWADGTNEERMELTHSGGDGLGAWCSGYVAAIADKIADWQTLVSAQKHLGFVQNPDSVDLLADLSSANICFPTNVTTLQLIRVLVKWLEEHPENLTHSRTEVVESAYLDAFRCEHHTSITIQKAKTP